MEKRTFKLINEQVRKRVCSFIMDAPEGYVVKITPPTRSLQANAKMWAVLTDISNQVNWHGHKLTPDEWKEVLSAALKQQKVVPGIDSGFVVIGARTSKMTVAEMSELIELAHAFGAEHGVVFQG